MSLAAWGDEGNVPQCAEDTAMWQELAALRHKLALWRQEYKDVIDEPDTDRAFTELTDAWDAFEEVLKPALTP